MRKLKERFGVKKTEAQLEKFLLFFYPSRNKNTIEYIIGTQ